MNGSMDLGGPNTITSYIIIAAYEYFLLHYLLRIKRFDLGAGRLYFYWLKFCNLLIINSNGTNLVMSHTKHCWW